MSVRLPPVEDRLRRRPTGRGSHRQREDHRAEVGDQPDQPDEHAEPVEGRERALVVPAQHHEGPGRVDDHQHDRDEPGDAVDVRGHAAHEVEHHARSDRVARQAEDEEGEVPPPQPSADPLAPHADGVEDERGGDEGAGEGVHARHNRPVTGTRAVAWYRRLVEEDAEGEAGHGGPEQVAATAPSPSRG